MNIRHHLLLFALALVVTFLAYGEMLRLPLYLDDAILWRYVDQLSLGELFTDAHLLPFYRPASFVPWKLIILTGVGHSAVVFYALSLVIHALDGYLVGVLAWRMLKDGEGKAWRLSGWLAALIYLLFPFSYGAVTWISSLGHLMMALGVLVAVIAFEAWWTSRERWLLPVIWLSTFIAAFSHENGVMIPALLAIPFLLSRIKRAEWRRAILPILPTVAISALYMFVWFTLPMARNNTAISLTERLSNALYFSQGIGLPLAQFGGSIWRMSNIPREAVAGVLGIGGGVIGLALAGRRGLYGALWYVVGIVLSVMFLHYEYALGGPRLMMLASIGTALLWSAAAARVWAWRPNINPNVARLIPKILAVALAAVILIPSAIFIAQRMSLHRTIASVYLTMLDETERNPSTVFLNLPAWLAYRDETFAVGSEGVIYMADYVRYSDLIFVNTGRETDNLVVSFDAVYPTIPAYWWDALRDDRPPNEIAALVRERGSGYAFNVVEDHWLWETAVQGGEASGDYPFADGIVLENLTAQGSNPVQVQLTWTVDTPQTVSAFIHLVCDGTIISQSDGAPLRGLLLFESWTSGETWTETRYLNGREMSGACTVRVGLYNPANGERVLTEDGAEWVEISVTP